MTALFLGGAAYLLLVPERSEEAGREGGRPTVESDRARRDLTAFGVILVGEFGDLTQLLIVNLAARYHQPWSVFIGAAAALVAVAALASSAGRALLRFLPLAVIRKVGGVSCWASPATPPCRSATRMSRARHSTWSERRRRTGAGGRPSSLDRWPAPARGFMPDDEGLALFDAAVRAGRARRRRGGHPVVEIGAWCGKSTLYLGAAAEATGAVLFSVDHHHGSEENQAGWEHHDPDLVDPRHRADRHPAASGGAPSTRPGSSARSSALVGDSPTVAARWGPRWPSASSTAATARSPRWADYRGWAPHVAVGGWLAIHDVFPDPADGGRPPYEIWMRRPGIGRLPRTASPAACACYAGASVAETARPVRPARPSQAGAQGSAEVQPVREPLAPEQPGRRRRARPARPRPGPSRPPCTSSARRAGTSPAPG